MMIKAKCYILSMVFALCTATIATAELSLPATAQRTERTVSDPARYIVPLSPWSADDGIYSRVVEGRIEKESWKLPQAPASPDQLLAPLLAQISQSHEILLNCGSQDCGGFDFRFEIDVLPAPGMYVDLLEYRFVSARSRDQADSYLTLLASSRDDIGYVQIVYAGPGAGDKHMSQNVTTIANDTLGGKIVVSVPQALHPEVLTDLSKSLEVKGHVILHDVVFGSGSANMGGGPIASLDSLALFLGQNPGTHLAIVGHTDATGSLDANQRISKLRAQAALDYLVREHGIDATRLEAEGVGYLAPIASNQTELGREVNRRVEAVLLPFL